MRTYCATRDVAGVFVGAGGVFSIRVTPTLTESRNPPGCSILGFVAFSRPQNGYIVVVAGSKLFRDKLAKFPVEKAARKISIAHRQDENAERTGHNDRRRHLWQPHTRRHLRSLRVPPPTATCESYELTAEGEKYRQQVTGMFGKTSGLRYGQRSVDTSSNGQNRIRREHIHRPRHAYSAMPRPECSRCDDGILLRKRQ